MIRAVHLGDNLVPRLRGQDTLAIAEVARHVTLQSTAKYSVA